MCIAMVKLAGSNIPMDRLDAAFKGNPDGAGYACVVDGKVKVVKSLGWEDIRDEYIADNAAYGADSVFLIHFRIATHGTIDAMNAHPWRMADGSAMIHNGIINMPGHTDSCSDSGQFVSHFLDHLPADWQYDIGWCTMVERMAQSQNKLAFLMPDGAYLIINEKSGHWRTEDDKPGTRVAGCSWYSNMSYIPRATYPAHFKAGPAKTTVGSKANKFCGCDFGPTGDFVACKDHSGETEENAWIAWFNGRGPKPTSADLDKEQQEAVVNRMLANPKMFCQDCETDLMWERDSNKATDGIAAPHSCRQVFNTCGICGEVESMWAVPNTSAEVAAITAQLIRSHKHAPIPLEKLIARFHCTKCGADYTRHVTEPTRTARSKAVHDMEQAHTCVSRAVTLVVTCSKCNARISGKVEHPTKENIDAVRDSLFDTHECHKATRLLQEAREIINEPKGSVVTRSSGRLTVQYPL